MQAEKAVGLIGAFCDDLAMFVFGKAVDHDAVEARCLAHDIGCFGGQLIHGGGLDEVGNDPLAQRIVPPQIGPAIRKLLDLQDDAAIVAMRRAFQMARFSADGFEIQEDRLRDMGHAGFGCATLDIPQPLVADQFGKRPVKRIAGGDVQVVGKVLAGVRHRTRGDIDGKKGSTRLYLTDLMNGFGLAAIEVDAPLIHATPARSTDGLCAKRPSRKWLSSASNVADAALVMSRRPVASCPLRSIRARAAFHCCAPWHSHHCQ